jgi:hypothetical protein
MNALYRLIAEYRKACDQLGSKTFVDEDLIVAAITEASDAATSPGVVQLLTTHVMGAARVAAILDKMERAGAERDEPEGARYVQISNTLARRLSATLMALEAPPSKEEARC